MEKSNLGERGREAMAALLERPGRRGEGSTQKDAQSSAIEREILALLRSPARHPPCVEDLRRELLPSHSELQIQNVILKLLDKGFIEIVFNLDFKMGFRLTEKGWG